MSERGLRDEKSEILRDRSTEVSCGSHEEYLRTISNSRQMRCRVGVEPFVEQVSRKSNVDRSSVEKLSRKKNTRSKI